MSDVETVTPHAVVGYCILWRLTSTQDVPSELLGRLLFFHIEVDRLFPCSLFVRVCVCVRLHCKQFASALKPWLTVRVWACAAAVRSVFFFFFSFSSMAYRVFWVVMATSDNDTSLSSQRKKRRDANWLSPSGTKV